MRMQDALNIINGNKGYRVHFEKIDGIMLRTDYFPEGDEPLIESEGQAWELAKRFASTTKGICVNIYVVGEDWCPVCGYRRKRIPNR